MDANHKLSVEGKGEWAKELARRREKWRKKERGMKARETKRNEGELKTEGKRSYQHRSAVQG